ncbi:MAG: hypothetical protein U0800_17150, partial [Isosphaeraceae bacterium]
PDRILFAAGDGRLYQHRLGGPDEADDLDANPLTPIAFDESLGWEEPPYLNEPHWPAPLTDRRVIFVTLSLRSPGAIRFDTPAIWWLRLDEAGDRVIEAGRLTTAVYDVDGVAAEEYRSACFDGPDGSPRLLYESRQDGQSPWQLRVAEVSTDPSTARPSAGPSRRISEDVLSGVHLLSPDGLSVYSIFHPWGFDPRVRKVPFAMPATLTVR